MLFKPSKKDREKYGMTEIDRTFEIMALSMVGFAMVAFFFKIIFF